MAALNLAKDVSVLKCSKCKALTISSLIQQCAACKSTDVDFVSNQRLSDEIGDLVQFYNTNYKRIELLNSSHQAYVKICPGKDKQNLMSGQVDRAGKCIACGTIH